MSLRKLLLLSFALASSMQATAAFAQSCTPISSVPYTISTPGKYCLTQNLRYDGAGTAIEIASDDTELDFAGYTLTGVASDANQSSVGVQATYRENITVRNGAIKNVGVGLQTTQQSSATSKGILVERMLFDGIRTAGMNIQGRNATIRDNRIASVTSTSTTSTAIGILVGGTGVRLINNTVSLVTSPFLPIGIRIAGPEALVQNNVISDLGVGSSGNGYGLFASSITTGAVIEGNRFIQSGTTQPSLAIYIYSSSSVVDNNMVSGYKDGLNLSNSPSSKYKNNTVYVTGTAYSGGTNIGGNN